MPKVAYGFGVVGLCISASVIFGIAHDMVTAHVCVEYFTVYHPKIIESESPIAMALLWGFVATWWMGAIFGALLAAASTLGSRPLLPLSRIGRALAIGLFGVFFVSMLTLACSYVVLITMHMDTPNRPAELLAVGATHGMSYFASAVLGVILCVWAWRTRGAIDPNLPPWIEP